MAKKMLIDSTHSEETRVAIMNGERLEEFEYESQFRKPLKGSIFLAKVTRVEPSLQAAFVNFGGNRHGFLPFSEIHPDYFRIPADDRDALMEELDEMVQKHEEALADNQNDDDDQDDDEDDGDHGDENVGNQVEDEDEPEDDIGNRAEDDEDEDDNKGNKKKNNNNKGRGKGRGGRGGKGRGGRKNFRQRRVAQYGDENFDPEEKFRFSLRRKYKIQEVVKRGQVVLVQASKEERGNKGAAFTTYLSLPGRYCVLMPNSPRAGGVSRKVSGHKDRNKLRDLLKSLEVPKGMSVILRTAGVERTKTEVKRDLDYLMKLWDNIRELTLESTAPSLVYEEANLIKRSIRDLYTRDLDEIIVAGDEGVKNAKNFMKMMIPSHVKKVKEYKDEKIPLFSKYKAESQIADIGEVQVTLPSGGYLVINPTEALVSVDVNSGRATKERHIEETALKTNLEAADEVARQLRLRDLGGLVVIDFIDMEDRRNNSKVEKRMREALSDDRARVQNSRISTFGLMELSRQRLNPSLTESQYETCQQCLGLGRVRSADATSIMVLRALEDEGLKKRAAQVIVHVSNSVALYILNNKRRHISALEEKYKFDVLIRVDDEVPVSSFRTEVSKPADRDDDGDDQNDSDDEDDNKSKKSRGRGRRGGRNKSSKNDQENSKSDDSKDDEKAEDKPKKKPAAKKAAAKKSEKKDDDDQKDEKPKKKPAAKKKAAPKKTAKKSDDDQKDEKAEKDSDKSSANDDQKPEKPAKPERSSAEYEKVNEAPSEKKKGWWSK